MLKMQSVSKTYWHRGRTINALDNVTLEIEQGEFVSVVGHSGSGKTTLLLMFGGMLSPASGEVVVDGDRLYALNTEERAAVRRGKIGFVFQTFNLVPYLTALENVQVPLFLAKLNKAEQERRAEALLERVGLSDRLDHKPSELSVGQQQRVALARMLANDPPIILADEPTGNLDPENAQSALDFLGEINREGRTVVMVTHDTRAAQAAHRTLRLDNGKVIAGLGASEVPTNPPTGHPVRVLFLCTGNSCRSQMAEGWARHLKPGLIEAYSAGTKPGQLDPVAVRVMAEAGVDISGQRAKGLEALKDKNFDYVITVCGSANEECPAFPGAVKRMHVGFEDPPAMAKEAANEEESLNIYRRVRDEIKQFVLTLPDRWQHEQKGI